MPTMVWGRPVAGLRAASIATSHSVSSRIDHSFDIRGSDADEAIVDDEDLGMPVDQLTRGGPETIYAESAVLVATPHRHRPRARCP